MIGKLLARARKEKGMTKTDLSLKTNINIGHLTHIEKSERHPSHKALKTICKALDIPYQPLMYTYDKEITKAQETYNVTSYISYNKILAVDNISGFIDCSPKIPSAAIAIKVPDNSMEPTFTKGSYVFLEPNTPLSSKDYGLFQYNDSIIIRRFAPRRSNIFLKADNSEVPEISVIDSDNFYIIGKIYKNK